MNEIYKSQRSKAWRNIMVIGVNELIVAQKFHINPEYDPFCWPGWNNQDAEDSYTAPCYRHDFTCDDHPMSILVSDIGFSEVTFNVFVVDAKDYIRVRASGWFERQNGAWLQTNSHNRKFALSGTRPMINYFAAKPVTPMGYSDAGRVM